MADNNAKKAEKKTPFFKGVKAEFGKISWPSRVSLFRKTGLVLVISVILGVIISVVDSAALQIFRLLIG